MITLHTLPSTIIQIQSTRQHLGILDLLRGFAAISVCLFHFTSGTNLVKLYSPMLKHSFAWGYLGVEIFFVISGFVIPYSLWGKDYRISGFNAFMRKRVVRICPPAYASILLVMLEWYLISYFLHHPSNRLLSITPTQFLENIFFIIPFTHNSWINGVFWTLSLEFQFYLVVGLFYRQIFAANSVWHFLSWSIALSLLQYLPFLPKETFFHFSSIFSLGAATLLYKQRTITGRQYVLALVVFTGLCGFQMGIWPALTGLITALTIAFVKINHPILSWLGKISYSLYLTHFLVGAAAEYLLTHIWPPTTPLQVGGEIGLCVLLALFSAYIYFLCVEKPFLRLSHLLKL
ncbi:acyltransferase family protein [Hymenobacter sp. PAMC 26628]|uniref:acyltransferase family protein n=1 Tax=Hymenobacter sp. PAMC 26628 TaxID=1484118 RepID=UPI00090203CD|nr:acyltransferase [Hymenobacter sp. PAMC 26628]